MRRRDVPALPLVAAVAITLIAATDAGADEMSAKLCPILDSVAGDTAGFIPEAVQAQLVMQVAGAYDYDPAALDAVLESADAATGDACPDARAAILNATKKPSLTDAMR
jgi:hypothetical protein